MRLVSCWGCGVVLNLDKMFVPTDVYDKEGDIDFDKSYWDGDGYVVAVQCPVCKTKIPAEK